MNVRDRYLPPTLYREVTPDHHQAAGRDYNSNWCHYAKTKTGLSGQSLYLDHVIRQNVSTWSCIVPPKFQKQPKKGTKVKLKNMIPLLSYFSIGKFPHVILNVKFSQIPAGCFDVKMLNYSFIRAWYN